MQTQANLTPLQHVSKLKDSNRVRASLARTSPRWPAALINAMSRPGIHPTRSLLWVRVGEQRMAWLEQTPSQTAGRRFPSYDLRRDFVVSTSAYGIGQVINSQQTPLGLHRIAQKIGGGSPIGTVFRSRKPVGLTSEGQPHASIVHRILWLEGLEPGLNRGGNVDTFERYIYIHGFGDESTLGRPQSHGCIHLAAKDLIPLYDQLPIGTLVWIDAGRAGTASL